jgi:branched-chain amino acid transport system ATP-binding protein
MIGPNGAGKTTVINLLHWDIRLIRGKSFSAMKILHLPIPQEVKKGICRSFQIMNIFPKLTVYENIQIPVFSFFNQSLSFFKSAHRHTDVNERVETLLSEIGLVDKKDVSAGTLSHGDQRVNPLH